MEKAEADQTRRLPGGQHGIPRDVVERNQRERLIAAMAEVCAERGYAAVAVADVTRQAGVSTASFYRQFEDKQACLLASFEELFGRLLEALERTCAAQLLAADIPTARLLTIEILAGGDEGVRLQHAAIDQLAKRLDVEWAAVAATVALVARRVVDGKAPSAAELKGCISH